MDLSTLFILFIFGLVFGSFLNVVILRYDGKHFLLDTKMIGGRSHCMQCGKTLRWFELIPLVSFFIQGGRCRRCGERLDIQYPIVELLSGLIFAFVPLDLGVPMGWFSIVVIALWIIVFEMLLLMALIDIRLGIIPDEINVGLGALGIFLIIFSGGQWDGALLKFLGALVGGVFFAVLIGVTHGKGMGMGDLKLGIPIGLLFGWPSIALVLILAFVVGAAAGVIAILSGKNTMKGTLPFGPFLALGAAATFFWGGPIVHWYLVLIGIR